MSEDTRTRVTLRGGPFDGRDLTIKGTVEKVQVERIGIGESLDMSTLPAMAYYVRTDITVGDRTIFVLKEEETNE